MKMLKTANSFLRHLLKLADNILHPLKGIPVPEFNDQYDATIL